MLPILKIIAILFAITYALRLVNAQSDLMVIAGLAIIGAAIYLFFVELNKMITHLKSKL
ncbi:hypothetical protein DYBT9275_05775 [Dyadobacter sp. CECT 9275]|uniref:Uncharacterized protein n=2 Tax=Dyadobacter helix TaxID=2822344 RepID=A0A916JIW7_9BACT|nr:hypothetical protein DYBT9275_05775 [Dyadobacter sp. CECT 9275]